MPAPEIRIQGLNRFIREANKAGRAGLVGAIKEANKEAAQAVAQAARPLTPERSGRLRASVRATATARAGVVRAGNKSKVVYAGVIHFGHPARGIRPQPFLYDAASRKTAEVLSIFEQRLSHALDRFNNPGASDGA